MTASGTIRAGLPAVVRDQRPAAAGTLPRGSRPATRHLPTRLRPADLLRIADQGAADILDGRYDALLPSRWDRTTRSATRLERRDDLELWLVSWVDDGRSELHDHAGSLGALTVMSGSLREYHWTGDDLRVRVLGAGDQAAFPIGWVHDLMRDPQPAGTGPGPAPTLTVQAYSPPLTAQSYYEVTDHGTLRRTRTELKQLPE